MVGYNTLFEYLAETTSSDQKVARVLSDWGHPSHSITSARLEPDGPSAEIQRRFVCTLFEHQAPRLRIESFMFALAASLLLYLLNTLAVQLTHVLHAVMTSALHRLDEILTDQQAIDTLVSWSGSVSKRFAR